VRPRWRTGRGWKVLDTLKAYRVNLPGDDFCLLVFAPTRGKAKIHADRWGPREYNFEFIELRAVRMSEMDKYAEGETSYIVWSNDELPDSAPMFYEEEEDNDD